MFCRWYDEVNERYRFRFLHDWSEWQSVEILSCGEWWERRSCRYCRRIEAEYLDEAGWEKRD